MEEKKKPVRPFSVIYADAKQALTRQVGNTMAAYGLPIFMAEGILSGILAEIRTNAGNELADDTARYEEELKEYYEAQTKEMQETFEKEKADLILAFENPVDRRILEKLPVQNQIRNHRPQKRNSALKRRLKSRRWTKWQISLKRLNS